MLVLARIELPRRSSPTKGQLVTYRAAGVPLCVISCVTEKGIVRAICHFGEPRRMVDELTKAVGILNSETEWTGYTYSGLPSYVSQWAGASDVPGGIYLFPWKTLTPYRGEPGTYWRDQKRRVSEREGQLLWRPSGWAGDRAEKAKRS